MLDKERDKNQDQIVGLLEELDQQGNFGDTTLEDQPEDGKDKEPTRDEGSEHLSDESKEPPKNNASPKNTGNSDKGDPQKEKEKSGFWKSVQNLFKKPQTRQTTRGANIKYQYQKLEERKKLLRILTWLLGIQMVFMNVVVMLIVVWCVFKHEVFREVNADVLEGVLGFTKYYVTAVLVELLSGVLYIVHSVFSEKEGPSEEKK